MEFCTSYNCTMILQSRRIHIGRKRRTIIEKSRTKGAQGRCSPDGRVATKKKIDAVSKFKFGELLQIASHHLPLSLSRAVPIYHGAGSSCDVWCRGVVGSGAWGQRRRGRDVAGNTFGQTKGGRRRYRRAKSPSSRCDGGYSKTWISNSQGGHRRRLKRHGRRSRDDPGT